MSSSQNYYSILQVKTQADLATIKAAYRKKIRRYHPDQFAADLSKLKRSGTAKEIQKLEHEIAKAQTMTQKINEAYAVLSDANDRAAYDQYLSDERQRNYQAEIRRQRMQHWDGERRTVKSRPHHRNPNIRRINRSDGVPWAILAGLIVLLIFVSALFSNAVTRNYRPATTFVPRDSVSDGNVMAIELQATTNAEQATRIARSTIVFQPTATPRSASQNELLGDQFMNFSQTERAINAYTDAILVNADNATLYLKRAVAYRVLFDEGDSEAVDLAIADFSEAIAIDGTLSDAYLGRGMLYYELFGAEGDFASEARSDLEQYLLLSDNANDDFIQDILDDLP